MIDIPDEVIAPHIGSDLEIEAKVWYYGNGSTQPWDELDNFTKFTWLAFAERRRSRD